ncbi:glutamic acid-rich protein-like isoform X3 [Microplitis mediator]|uniref:glutamic acid-rich protein-like isoform X3 n=1 Tax=Microplitis mediator TaxID=375433 RepID=UPI0025536304|nr:glutamic acid-rich protein-like isoform X3 [Microplitis mediator]
MSGDVQPRKRKEKRRKRVEGEYHIQRIQILVEDEDSGTPPPQLVNPAEHAMDNVTIHVYKEGSTGGHWCAKIIFFALFSVLIGLVGVIILEHRGTTDVDTPISSSKWAMIFDGWVDDILPSHDNEPHEEENSKEVEHEDEDDHDKESHEEDHDDEDEDEGIGSEEEDNEEDEEDDDEVNESEAVDIEDEDDEEENSEDIEDDEEENSEDIEDDEEENSEDIQDDEEEEEEEEEEEDDNEVDVSKVENDEDEGFEDDDNETYENLDETDELEDENESADKENDDNDENEEEDENNEEDEDDITNISAPDVDVSVEGVHSPSKEDEETDYEFMGMPGIHEKEDFEKMEIVEGIEVPKEENEDVLDETSVPVKFGVGVALVIAAHIVLVRRWKNEETMELKRRNSIVPPTIPKKLIVTGDSNKKQQQAKTYQDLKSKYTNLQQDIKRVNKPLSSVENLRDVEKNVSKTKNEPQEIYTSESERFSGTEIESDYLDDDLEAEEDLEDEEELDDEEDIEAEEVDDTELVAKLEAKYGKLPTPSQSEEEEEDEEEEEEEDEEEIEDEEEEEEDDEGDWKPGINAPKAVYSSVEDKKLKEKESARERQVHPPPRGGRQAFESIHPGDYDNVNIQDEIEHWLARDLDN